MALQRFFEFYATEIAKYCDRNGEKYHSKNQRQQRHFN